MGDRQRKSSGSETTFAHDLTMPAEIEAGVVAMADRVWAWCTKTGTYGRTVTVKVKFADFRQITRSHSFTSDVGQRELLVRASIELVRTLSPVQQGIRLLGVTVSNFDQSACALDDLPLFGSG